MGRARQADLSRMPELRARLRAVLDWENLSDRKASLAAGLNENAVSRILEDRANYQPDISTLEKLALKYHLDADELLYLAGHRRDRTRERADPLIEMGRLLSRGWSEPARRALLTLAELTRGVGQEG